MMGPGRPANECGNEELIQEFEAACRGGDYEFAPEYRAELLRRLDQSVEALEFYADTETYDIDHLSKHGFIIIDKDGGDRARKVLQSIKGTVEQDETKPQAQ